jgi:hypothetical protein
MDTGIAHYDKFPYAPVRSLKAQLKVAYVKPKGVNALVPLRT